MTDGRYAFGASSLRTSTGFCLGEFECWLAGAAVIVRREACGDAVRPKQSHGKQYLHSNRIANVLRAFVSSIVRATTSIDSLCSYFALSFRPRAAFERLSRILVREETGIPTSGFDRRGFFVRTSTYSPNVVGCRTASAESSALHNFDRTGIKVSMPFDSNYRITITARSTRTSSVLQNRQSSACLQNLPGRVETHKHRISQSRCLEAL